MIEYTLHITSLKNERVKQALRLRKHRNRSESGLTLAEGTREVQRAIESECALRELYVCPELYTTSDAQALAEQMIEKGIPVYHCTESVFQKMSYRESPDGILAIAPLIGCSFEDLRLPDHPLLLVAEGIEKPGNLGTILRTADAVGVDAVIICGNKTDISNPNVIRASIGTLFFIPIVQATTDETIQWLSDNRIQIIAALPEATCRYTEVDMRSGSALVVGSEDTGLSPAWTQPACISASIPMNGKNDSLNVSTAAAILLYEALRQRNAS